MTLAALRLVPIYDVRHDHRDPSIRAQVGPKSWVADITDGGRIFLRAYRDYRQANNRGTRGVREYYFLYPGRVYEAHVVKGRWAFERYYCIVQDGKVVRLKEPVIQDKAPRPDYTSQLPKRERTYLDIDVYTAARERIRWTFDRFPRLYLSFSGGKDSTVLMHMVMEEAIRRGRKVGILFIDLEAQYKLTIQHIQRMYDMYADHIEPYWVALPISLRNAVSQYDPQWVCWGDGAEWVRQPPEIAITDRDFFPFYYYGMEFEEFVPAFGHWYAQGEPCASIVATRTQESLNRWRGIMSAKTVLEGKPYTTWTGETTFTVTPLYDWRTEDIWTYHARYPEKPYNEIYNRMHAAGLTIHQARLCQPYGDDQRKGLWLYQVLEPETWTKIVARVNGANLGALYARESGNVLGNLKIQKPEGHTWESYSMLLLASMPERTREHYLNKIAQFLSWWNDNGYPQGIPDEADPREESAKKVPSWRRICRVLLRNDYWCKGLSFTPTKSDAYKKYVRLMQKKRAKWGIFPPGEGVANGKPYRPSK